MDSSTATYWDKCRTCGKGINFQSRYYTCSVSSCNRKSNPLIFCSVDCWDIHAPVMNHKNAGAEENWSPTAAKAMSDSPRRILIKNPPPSLKNSSHSPSSSHSAHSGHDSESDHDTKDDILIVASKLKDYVKKRSGGFNTSASVMEALSHIVRHHCNEAIDRARRDGRKTIMDRDFEL